MPLVQENLSASTQKDSYKSKVLTKPHGLVEPGIEAVSTPPTSTHHHEGSSAAEGQKTALNSDPKTRVKAVAQCIAGGISAGTAMVFVYPLDVVKTKLQTFGHLYEGGLHSLAVEWRAGGLRAIYRGLSPATLGAGAESCAYFMSFGVWQDVVRAVTKVHTTEQMSPTHNMFAGQLTGMTVSLLMTPIELVKCRQQAVREVAFEDPGRPPGPFPTPSQLALHIYRCDGVRGLYTGFVGVFTKMVLGFAAMFGTYDLFRSHFVREGQTKDQIGDLRNMVSGAAGGVAYWAVAYPLDLVKVRMQVKPKRHGHDQRAGFYRLFLRALRTEGIFALYKGFSLTGLRACIAFSITFALYERIRGQLLLLHSS